MLIGSASLHDILTEWSSSLVWSRCPRQEYRGSFEQSGVQNGEDGRGSCIVGVGIKFCVCVAYNYLYGIGMCTYVCMHVRVRVCVCVCVCVCECVCHHLATLIRISI